MDACDDIDINSRRTRINIATSCISTIFLCTWVAFHPNIPGLREPKWKVIRRRIGCMIGGILAPEIYVLLAARQFIAARHLAKEYSNEGWTLTHGFFALMGGFILHYNKTAEIVLFDPDMIEREAAFVRNFTSLQAFERRLAALRPEFSNHISPRQESGHFVHSLAVLEYIQKNTSDTVEITLEREEHHPSIDRCIAEVKRYNYYSALGAIGWLHPLAYDEVGRWRSLEGTLIFLQTYERDAIAGPLEKYEDTTSAPAMENAVERKELIPGHISDPVFEISKPSGLVPRINEQDIRDKSKSDMLTKTIALFQVAWFVLQLCARYHQNLAITELEILTLAFCILNFATYALWWKKPFSVDRGYSIRWRDDDWEVIAPPTPPFVKRPRDLQDPKPVATDASLWKKLFAPAGDSIALPSRFRKMLQGRNKRFRRWWGSLKFDDIDWFSAAGGVIRTGFKLVTVQIAQGKTSLHMRDKRVSTFSPAMMKLGGRDGIIYYLSGCFIILVFGSIHFLAWSSGPTNTDKLLWRVFSICATVLPVVVFLFELLNRAFLGKRNYHHIGRLEKCLAHVLFYILSTALLFYILVRIGLLVMVVRSLIHCPPSALEAVPWSQIIPHV